MALKEYGFIGDNLYTPRELELKRCISINTDDFTVEINNEELLNLAAVCRMDLHDLKQMVYDYADEAKLEALSEYVRLTEPDRLNYGTFRKYKHLRPWVDRLMGGYDVFKELCYVDDRIFAADVSTLINYGREFERLVGEALVHMYGSNVKKQVKYKDAIPDFVIGDTWIDAKLSKSTAFRPEVKTIEKYRKFTNDLKIVFAVDDTHGLEMNDVDGVEFIHISEFYSELYDSLVHELKEFVQRAGKVKGLYL